MLSEIIFEVEQARRSDYKAEQEEKSIPVGHEWNSRLCLSLAV
jgi:hypothetical protein